MRLSGRRSGDDAEEDGCKLRAPHDGGRWAYKLTDPSLRDRLFPSEYDFVGADGRVSKRRLFGKLVPSMEAHWRSARAEGHVPAEREAEVQLGPSLLQRGRRRRDDASMSATWTTTSGAPLIPPSALADGSTHARASVDDSLISTRRTDD